MPKNKLIFIPHANINFAWLEPERYKFVMEASYEAVIDVFREKFPRAKFCFETSGYTIEQMALYAPRCLEKLIDGCRRGQIEFIGAPYAHSILANYPAEDGRKALEYSMEAYERILGFKPRGGFPPEFTWKQYVPEMFQKAGFEYMLLDWESYLISNRPEVSAVDRNPHKNLHWGGTLPYYPVDPSDKTLHFPLQIIPGLKGFMRSDRITIKNLFYFMGRTFTFDKEIEIPAPVEDPVGNIHHWAGNGEGATVIYADDIEYLGTNCYFEMKYTKNEKPKVFQPNPESLPRLEAFIGMLLEDSELITLGEAMDQLPTVTDKVYIEDGLAWHRTYSQAWADTPACKELDAIVDEVRKVVKLAEQKAVTPWQKTMVHRAWQDLIMGENSDGRWPPPPGKICQYNWDFCRDALKRAAAAVEWAKHV